MAFTQNNGVHLHWEEQGEGTPILLVMGHRFSSRMWYPALPDLAAKHRVIYFDNRGTGESDAPTHFSIGDLAGDALAVMDAAGVDSAHVYGVSMGGVVALEIALQAPHRVQSLILGCTGILSAEKRRLPKVLLGLYLLPPKIVSRIRKGKPYGENCPRELAAKDEAVLAVDKWDQRGVMGQARALREYVVTKEAVAALQIPALVLHGTSDTVVPYSYGVELSQTLPNVRMASYEGAGHNFLVTDAPAANNEVLSFVNQVEEHSLGNVIR